MAINLLALVETDSQFEKILELAKAATATAIETIGEAENASEAAKAASQAARAARDAVAEGKVAAALELGKQIKAVTNGQGLKAKTISAMVDKVHPLVDKNDPRYSYVGKCRSLFKTTLACAIMADHAVTICDAARAADPEGCGAKGVRRYDVFMAAMRACRDMDKAGKPFEIVPASAVVAKFADEKAKRAAAAAQSGAASALAPSIDLTDPMAGLRAAKQAAEARGLDVSSIVAAITAIAALVAGAAGEAKPEAQAEAKPEAQAEADPDDLTGVVGSLIDNM